VVPALIRIAQNDEAGLGLSALTALGIVGPEARAGVPIILEGVKSSDPVRRQIALQALTHIRLDTSALPALNEAVKDSHGYNRALALEWRWRVDRQTNPAVQGLTSILTERPKDLSASQAALQALGRIAAEDQSAASALREMAKSNDVFISSRAANLLTRLAGDADKVKPVQPAEAVARLREQLSDLDPTVRANAVSSCAAAGCQQLLALLEQTLAEETDLDRLQAAKAVWRAGGKVEATAALAESLKDPAYARVRWQAAAALGEMGSEAKTAVPALRQALKDHSSVVRTAAAAALRKVDPEAAAEAGIP
jgi:HEAT repeat protein